MNETYSEYLNSREWLIKRSKRLAMSKYSCEACGSNKAVEVHHLTYDRVFRENMEDLLPLCYIHHRTAEDLISKGELSRKGDVQTLRETTLRLIQPEKIRREGKKKARNRAQEELLESEWFYHALKLNKHDFKALVRNKFADHKFKNWMIGNAFALRKRGFSVRMQNPGVKVAPLPPPKPKRVHVTAPETYQSKQINGIWSNNPFQEELLSQAWFNEALKFTHREFKKIIKQRTRGIRFRNKVRANAFTLHERAQKLPPTNLITLIGDFTAEDANLERFAT